MWYSTSTHKNKIISFFIIILSNGKNMRAHNNNFQTNNYLTPGVKFIITCNIVVFIIQVLMKNSSFLNHYFALTPLKVIENFWLWQLITHGFMHDINSLGHIFFNMLTLFFFGHYVERYYGTRKFYIGYVFCMLVAAFAYIIDAYLTKNSIQVAVGASGATSGILMLASFIVPRVTVLFMFIIPIALRTLVWFIIGAEFYYAWMYPYSKIAAIVHLGGLAAGFIFFKYQGVTINWVDTLEKKIEKEEKKQKSKKYRNMRNKVDGLLDKIKNDGMHSLSDKEKDFLKDASKKYRKE